MRIWIKQITIVGSLSWCEVKTVVYTVKKTLAFQLSEGVNNIGKQQLTVLFYVAFI